MRFSRFLAAYSLLVFFLGACTPPSPEPISDVYSLVTRLRAEGAPAEPGGTIPSALFSVDGRLLLIGDEEIQAYEYGSESAAKADVARIRAGGEAGAGKTIWVVPPRFYLRGRLLVVYVGTDQNTLALMNETLGPPLPEGGAAS